VFKLILPALEAAKINYWAYGGVSIAARNGNFFRQNQDVDVFVKENDFNNAKQSIKNVCNLNDLDFVLCKSNKNRPKVEVKKNDKEIFSVIPVYMQNNHVLFRYNDGDQEYDRGILQRVERRLSDYEVITPPNISIKELFINHIKARPDKVKKQNFQKDGQNILSKLEFEKYFIGVNYERR
jgi:hypothetical protein